VDRLEFTANLGRSIGFDFPHVLVGRAAAQKHVDHGFVRFPPCRFLRTQHLRQTQTGHAAKCKTTDLEETASSDPVAHAVPGTMDGQHVQMTLSRKEWVVGCLPLSNRLMRAAGTMIRFELYHPYLKLSNRPSQSGSEDGVL